MFEKLEEIKKRYEELTKQISDSDIIANQELWQKLVKEHAELEEIVSVYEAYMNNARQLDELREMLELESGEMAEMVREELESTEKEMENQTNELKLLLIPKDPNDNKNVILEIRAGTGGEEAALFGMNLLRMYTRYAERNHFKTETLSSNYTELGGVKEIVLNISGKGAYSRLKYESGVHRVQRVPETESGGRIRPPRRLRFFPRRKMWTFRLIRRICE